MDAITATGIFICAYILIATEKINKTIVAVLAASLVIGLGLISFEEAVHAVDFNVIFLLVGMMTAVSILSKTGFFEWTAISVAKAAKGRPLVIMFLLLLVTAVLSAFLDNVTTIILLVPVTILITQILELSPIPFVIMEALASNIGGAATLIGDPPNIIIGSQGELSFNDFLVNLGPGILAAFTVFLGVVLFIFRKNMKVTDSVRERVIKALPRLAIVDKANMIKGLSVMGLIVTGFFLHSLIGIEPGIIALAGSMLMMVLCKSESDETLMKVEWGVIFFFIGLFMLIASLEKNGVIEYMSRGILKVGGNNVMLMAFMVLWGSALLSSVLDNIPFVITMVPLLKLCFGPIAEGMGITDPALIHAKIAAPLWWALAMGACLGGNGTLIGASANVVMARISERNKYPISFMLFMRYGFLLMLLTVGVCMLYLWLRYF